MRKSHVRCEVGEKQEIISNAYLSLLTKLSAKCNVYRLVPDYQSAKIMRANYEGNTFPPMGCRSHLSPKKIDGEYKWYGRFNIGIQKCLAI